MAKRDVVTLKDGQRIDTAGMFAVCWHCRKLKPLKSIGLRRMTPDSNGLIAVQPRCTPCRKLTV